ncbi:MAG: Transcriptional regulatory protein sin3 [Sclerophora amabilis]|nr:MAG: Transcriptional regulatory protein sin3 [Sclerophora amabilis]
MQGLLSGIGNGTSSPSGAQGAPSAQGNGFGGSLQPDGTPRAAPQPQIQPASFIGNAHNLPGAANLPQNQQPILNDALSYLDQVKVQFVDQPDVYNRFLDIMKDFKSQAIDTPGVIDRVSNLFAGNPNLIQGFNTFLPPGYRIECGTGDDPNAIRVTTPMGTVSSTAANFLNGSNQANGVSHVNGNAQGSRPGSFYDQMSRSNNANWSHQQQHPGSVVSEGIFSPNGRTNAPQVFGQSQQQTQNQGASIDPQAQREHQASAVNAAALAQHQQEQQGVSQLQNAITIATNGPQSRQTMMQSSPDGGQAPAITQSSPATNGTAPGAPQASQAGLEKRGPVEFNHAISYVNKIKNRFNNQPEIYKQFLEILQTYQRESKPIQDVYAQVTKLFDSAPDLLEDFKQFLPESAAQAKAQAAAKQAAEDAVMLSNVRGDPAYASSAQLGQGTQQTPGPQMKMPPVGNFAPPPSAGKENKKKRNGVPVQAGGSVSAQPNLTLVEPPPGVQPARAGPGQNVHPNKVRRLQLLSQMRIDANAGDLSQRSKTQHSKSLQPDMPIVSPTLVPALPEPIPPASSAGASTEEIAFFDRVKKFIGNKQTMNEFLKLCNLFSQDLIDKNVLVSKVGSFIGGNPELMTWFERFVGYDGKDEIIENKPRPNGRVVLSKCRGNGPSYRLLPRRERLKQCSGRDEMCYSVLNDDWASHPTWASEDSGFVAHRKNVFEESLHRIEEERHDYDFNIEANLRTIQLIEPIAQQILFMSDEERANFTLMPGLGGQSTTIYQRVVKKLYGREKGQRVIEDLHAHPCAVVPILLNRLKQKDEEWKASQREWEKIWREQQQKMFWKSLDHMGINAKTADKRQFTAKTLLSEIQAKHEEQIRQRTAPWNSTPKHQFEYSFDDKGVVLDAVRLLLVFVEHTTNYNAADRQRLDLFLKDFIPKFFGLAQDKFEEDVNVASRRSPLDEEMEDVTPGSTDASSVRGRRAVNGRKTDLLRGVLDRGRVGKSGAGEVDSPTGHDSKESTPDVSPAVDDDGTGGAEDSVAEDTTEDKWIEHPGSGAARKTKPLGRDIPRNEPFRRENFSLYCNSNIYCFLRMFQILYERLLRIKENEPIVSENVRRAKIHKPAQDLKLLDKRADDFFKYTGPGANYYQQVLEMCQDLIVQQVELVAFEELLRRFYMNCGWHLYALDKLLVGILRFALNIVSSDVKDKSNDIAQLFYKDREREETTHQTEINYRKQVEKLIKDGDVFRIVFNQPTTKTTIQMLRKEDSTFEEDTMSPEAKWSYYVASYIQIEPTEGVPIDGSFSMPFLKRNLPENDEEPEDVKRAVPHAYENNLDVRICVNSYKMLWMPKSEDWFVHSERERAGDKDSRIDLECIKAKRKAQFEEKMVTNNRWMQGLSKDEIDQKNQAFRKWVEGGTTDSPKEAQKQAATVDQPMTDA